MSIPQYYGTTGYLMVKHSDHLKVVEQLKAENEALRKDAERYQWVVDNPVLARAYLVTDLGQGIYMKSKAWEIDRDIDAAMGKGEQS